MGMDHPFIHTHPFFTGICFSSPHRAGVEGSWQPGLSPGGHGQPYWSMAVHGERAEQVVDGVHKAANSVRQKGSIYGPGGRTPRSGC